MKLYTEAVEISAMVRSLNVPYETVRSWLRAEGEKAIKKIEHRRKVILEKSIKFKRAYDKSVKALYRGLAIVFLRWNLIPV